MLKYQTLTRIFPIILEFPGVTKTTAIFIQNNRCLKIVIDCTYVRSTKGSHVGECYLRVKHFIPFPCNITQDKNLMNSEF